MKDAYQHYQSALKLFGEKRVAEAIAELESAIRLDPNLADAYEALGVLYAQQGKLDEAIEVMKKLVSMDPENMMAHTNLSRFYQQKGWIDEAEEEQTEARRLSWKMELKKDAPVGRPSQTPEQLAQESERALEARIEIAKKAIALDPKDVLGYFSLGTVYVDEKRYQEAVSALQQAVQVDPKHSPSYASLGKSLEMLGRYSEAEGIYKKGIEVATKKGDIIPLRRMESRLKRIPFF